MALAGRPEDPFAEAGLVRLIENASDVIYRFRYLPSVGFEYLSPAVTTMTGYTPEEFYADPNLALEVVHIDDRKQLIALRSPGASLAEPLRLRMWRKDGTLIWIEQRHTGTHDSEGNLVAIEGIVRDITERIQTESRLRLLATIVESSDDAIFSATADGNIISWNDAAEKIYGYSAQEAVGRPLSIAVPRDQWDEVSAIVKDVTTDGRVEHYETMRLKRDGTRVDLSVTLSPVRGEAGPIVGIVAISHDITERRRAFEELTHQRFQLRALSRRLVEAQESERRRIARELHDEIGQVLTGLKLALETVPAPLPEDVAAILERAQKLVEDLMAIVRDISQGLRPPMLDDLGLLPALEWLIEKYSTQSEVRVVFEAEGLNSGLDPEAETAAFRIAQEALTNVARHAGVDSVSLRVVADAQVMRVEVQDGGVGFDPLAVPVIASGLTGMRERAVALGGRLTIDSAPGKGSRLVAVLPLNQRREQ